MVSRNMVQSFSVKAGDIGVIERLQQRAKSNNVSLSEYIMSILKETDRKNEQGEDSTMPIFSVNVGSEKSRRLPTREELVAIIDANGDLDEAHAIEGVLRHAFQHQIKKTKTIRMEQMINRR